MAEKKTIELEIKTDSVKSLRTQLREAQQEVQILSEKFGATSREATEAARRAAQLKDAIGDAKALTDAFNPDAKFKALTSSLGGVASGFTAYQGAMGLAGVESKELEKQLLKVQAAMALSTGLQQMGEARDSFVQLGAVIKTKLISAFSSLKSALISTGIGLFVIAIGVLIANFDKLKNVVSENTANAQKFADSTRMEGVAARETANDFAEYERTLKRLGYAEDEIRKKRGNKLKDAIASTEKEIEANKKLYKEQLKNLETVYGYDKLGLNATGRALYGSEEDAAKTREYIQGLRKDLEKLKNDQFELEQKAKEEEKTADKVVKSSKKKVVAKKDELAEKLKAEKDYLEEISKAEESWLRLIADIAEKQQAKQKKDQEDRIQAAKKAEEDIYNNAKGFLQASITDDENNLQAKRDLLEVEKEILLQNKELTEGEIAAIEAKYRKDREQLDKDDLAKKKILESQKLQAVQDTFSTIGNLAELFANKSKKQQKAAFEIQKAANIANATIDTYKAAQGAYASLSSIPVVGVGLGIAAAAAATSAGLLNVKRIASQKFGSTPASGGGGGGGGTTPSTPNTSSGVIAPKFNVVGSSANQLNTLQQQPIQAYVVSGDVTSAQSLDRNRIKNATL